MYSNINNDNIPNIGPISTLEYMVESTFGFDKNLKNNILDHIISLEKYIFRWRSVLGDGNCFFRAVIFGYLENIIFNRNINHLKYIMKDIDMKFDESYSKTRQLPYSIRNEFANMNFGLVIKILYLIYEILVNSDNTDSTLQAYEVLLKSFNFCSIFDSVLFYLSRR